MFFGSKAAATYAREGVHLKMGARAGSRVHGDLAGGVVRLAVAVEGGRPPDRWLSTCECENRPPCLSVGPRRGLVKLIGLRVCEGEDGSAGPLLAAAAGPAAGPGGVPTYGGE